MSKQTFHKFNRTLEQEPEVKDTKAVAGDKKIQLPTFETDLQLIEDLNNTAPVETVAPDVDHLKFLFGELGSLLATDAGMAEEAINTNPVPMEPTINKVPPTIQPLAEPAAPVGEEEKEEPVVNTPGPDEQDLESFVSDQSERRAPVTEAKHADFQYAADTLTRPRAAPVAPPPPEPTPTPIPAPTPAPVVPERKGWVFTVHRNRTTNLIERIEADPK